MALATYDELVATTADWLMRADLQPAIPTFVALAEAHLARLLRLRSMVKTATITALDGAAPLPSDCLQVKTVASATDTLSFLPPTQYSSFGFQRGTTPAHYSVAGNELLAHPSAADLTISYYARPPALGPDQQQNVWLTEHPDVVLYAVLLMSAPYLLDDQRGIVWKTLLEEAIRAAEEADDRAEYAGHLIIRAD